MARSTVFDKLANSWNISKEIERIHELIFERESIRAFNRSRLTIVRVFDYYIFGEWNKRGHCLDFNDFLDVIEFEDLFKAAKADIESQLDFLELCYNLIYQVDNLITDQPSDFIPYDDYSLARTIIDDCLDRLNYRSFIDESDSTVILVEKDTAVSAVVEIEEDQEIALDIIQYNHHTLKGNIKKKKSILIKLANELEASRTQLTSINKSLATDVFMLFNNLDIRHNNAHDGSKNYQKVVAEMSSDELENWYDELYQMVLLAKLELDNAERTKKVAELKASFT